MIKDTQLVELAGRNRLASELQRAGIEVSRPERDHGIDLVVYLDRDKEFLAKPIQMKVASGEGFDVLQRYKDFPSLIFVYVWNVAEPESRYFILGYNDAEKIAAEMGWTKTKSWRGETSSGVEGYGVWKVNDSLRALLKPYEVDVKKPEDWKRRLFPENYAVQSTA